MSRPLKNREEIIEALEGVDAYVHGRYPRGEMFTAQSKAERAMEALMETFTIEKKKPKGGCRK